MTIEVGSAVILNDVERPWGSQVAVVCSIDGEFGMCKYLNNEQKYRSYNRGDGMRCDLDRMTMLAEFGVELCVDASENTYCCQTRTGSVARYPDGRRRDWQEQYPEAYPLNRKVFEMLKQ